MKNTFLPSVRTMTEWDMKRAEKIDLKKIQWITFVCMAVVLLLAISAIIADAPSLMPLTAIFNVVCGVASAAIPKLTECPFRCKRRA